MTNERKELLIEKMDAVFAAMRELAAEITEEDIEWAEGKFDEVDGEVEGDDEEIVMRLYNLREDLVADAGDIV